VNASNDKETFMATELAEIGSIQSLAVSLRNPTEILVEAQERAAALQDVVKRTGSSQRIGDKDHLKIEAWITIGQFYGCTARCRAAEPVEIEGITGFKAHAEVVHDRTGQVITEADAYCMRDEDRWNTRSVYEWQGGQKTKVGDERVPMFQLASMAQTRAMAKALAAKFRWVVVLAGYSPTPAEEMTGIENAAEGGEKKARKEKPKPAPSMPFGVSKGKQINDPSVPVNDLKDMLASKERRLADPARDAKWDAADSAFIAALQAEIAMRDVQAAKQEPRREDGAGLTEPDKAVSQASEASGSTLVPMTEEQWEQWRYEAESMRPVAYYKAKQQIKLGKSTPVPPAKREAFRQAFDSEKV